MSIRFASLDVLGQVELDMAQDDPLASGGGRVLLQHLELDLRLLHHAILVDGQADLQVLLVVPADLVVLDGSLGRAAAVLGSDGRWKVPLDVGRARDEGDVVEIDDLSASAACPPAISCSSSPTFRFRSNLG